MRLGNRSLTIKRRARTTTNKIIVVVFSACQFSISLFSHFPRFDNNIFYFKDKSHKFLYFHILENVKIEKFKIDMLRIPQL